MGRMNTSPKYRRSDLENIQNNNPFSVNNDINESPDEFGAGEDRVPFRRFSLQHSFSSTETKTASASMRQISGRLRMEGMYAAGESSTTSNSNVVYLDSLGPEELRQVTVKLADERDQLLQEINAISKHNHLLRRQLHRNSLNPGWSRGRDVALKNYYDKSVSSIVAYSRSEGEASDTNEEDDIFLLPDDLKDSPNKISVMLSQSMTVLAQINNQDVLEKVCAGGHIAKQLMVGNIVGYCTSHLIRKFGKLAAGSIIGSSCLLKLAHHRGYIAIDWKRIQKQIETPHLPGADSLETDGEKCDDIAWISKKIQQIRNWSADNTYTVIGFCAGFALNNLNM